jgi:hypothetical protein
MRHLLRALVLAIVLIPALAAAPPARAESPIREACINGGTCSMTGQPCTINAQCAPHPQTCVCN